MSEITSEMRILIYDIEKYFENKCEDLEGISNKIEENESKIDKIFEIANNAIYFNDRSDYLTALRQICHVIKPDDETIGEVCIE